MRTRSLPLIACLLWPDASLAAGLELLGRFDMETEIVVGLSGIEVDDQGRDFLVISDRGWWVTGTIDREGGIMSGVRIDDIKPILGSHGLPVSARRVADWSDSEGLAVAPDGRIWVSFERWAHVAAFNDGILGSAKWIKDHPTFYDLADNWELEAAALSPEGELYTFSERPLAEGFPIYRLGPEGWVIDGYLPERDLFSIVGADFDMETGDLYLLERKLVVGIWWQSRVRRIRLDDGTDETLWTSDRGEFGNLEGISVWRDAAGLRLVMVSDNNAERDEPTQFVEFRLTE